MPDPQKTKQTTSVVTVPAVQENPDSGCLRTGCYTVIVLVIFFFAWIFYGQIYAYYYSPGRTASRRASCQQNLKLIGLGLRGYATAHDGAYPTISSEPGRIMFSMDDFAVEDPAIFQCPSNHFVYIDNITVSDIGDDSYFYISHIITDDKYAHDYERSYRNVLRNHSFFDQDFYCQDGSILYRISEEFVAKAGVSKAEIPVMIDYDFVHFPKGCNVLYMDGHVEFYTHPDEFPFPKLLAALQRLDELSANPRFNGEIINDAKE